MYGEGRRSNRPQPRELIGQELVTGRYLVSGKREIFERKPGEVVEVEMTRGALDALLNSGNLSEIPEGEDAPEQSEASEPSEPDTENEPSDGRPKPHEE